MSKVIMSVTLKSNTGATLAGGTVTKEGTTGSAAKALVDAEIQARVDAASNAQQDLLDAHTAYNS